MQHRDQPFSLVRLLSREEAVRSSAIEGTTATLDELLLADPLLEDAEAKGTSRGKPDELATIRAYALALEGGLAQPSALDPACILALHREVFSVSPEFADGRKGSAGAWRDRDVWVGRSRDITKAAFIPPPHPLVPQLMEGHSAWLAATSGRTAR